jgi:hypothetical protein
MADTTYQAGATSKIVTVEAIVISTGLPYTAGVFNTATISATYTRDGATPTTITLVTATAGTYTSSGFVHRGKGVYEIGAPTAALASGADGVQFAVDGIADVLFRGCRVELTGSDPRAAAVTTTAIADEVQTRTIAAVTTVNGLAANTVTATAIASNAITSAKIATDAITDEKIAASAVTKVADGVVDAEIALLPTFSRTGTNGNTGLQIGSSAFDITTNINAEPIVQIDIPPSP